MWLREMMQFTTWATSQDPSGYSTRKDALISALNVLPPQSVKDYVLSNRYLTEQKMLDQFDWSIVEGSSTILMPSERQKLASAVMDCFNKDITYLRC